MNEQTETKIADAAIAAHKFCFANWQELREPQLCGCFYCLERFDSRQLTEEDCVEERNGAFTVCCPFCGIDSVIGESSGYKMTSELLQEMNNYWFGLSGSQNNTDD